MSLSAMRDTDGAVVHTHRIGMKAMRWVADQVSP
jgi:hypothetical protein